MCTKRVKWFLNLITFIFSFFISLRSMNLFASSSFAKHTIKHIVVDTPHSDYSLLQSLLCQGDSLSLVCFVRSAGAKCFIAAQLFISSFHSLTNRICMMMEMSTTAKIDKQLVRWLRCDGKAEKIQSHLLCHRRIFTPNHFYASQRVYVLSFSPTNTSQ